MTEEHPGMNSITDIKAYLSASDQKPLASGEFVEFWKSLTEEEREEFRKTPLTAANTSG